MTPLNRRSDGCRLAATLLIACFLCGTSAASADTVAWDGGGGDGAWGNPLNWSGDLLPGPNDDVVIGAIPGLTVFHASGLTEIASLQTASPLTIGGGSLHVAGTAVVSSDAAVTLDGGSLVGGTWNVIAGALRATSATTNTLVGVAIEGDLELETVFATARVHDGLAIDGTVALTGAGARLVFEGDQTVSAGTFLVEGVLGLPARLAIDGDATVVLGPQTTVHAVNANLGGSVFAPGADTLVSQGTIVVDADDPLDDTVVRWLGHDFVNGGTLQVVAGEARLTSTFWSSAGSIEVGEAGKLRLGGSFTTADVDTIVNAGPPLELVGVLDNRGSLLMIDEAIGTLQLLGGTIDGGEIVLAGGSLAFTPNSGNLLIDPVITGSIALVEPAERFHVAGDLWLDGTLSFLGSGCSITFDDPVASILAGTFLFTVAPSTSLTQNINIANGGTLAIEKGVVLSGGKGKVNGDPESTLVFRGELHHDTPGSSFYVTVGTLLIDGAIGSSAPDGTLWVTVAALTVTGSLSADGATISVD
ncbi:MAG: hypothetical protein KDA22_05160, partial [Phycisphaerales bacterium]|nr:hypothetical protein [Phycisphaerales bacterium]